MPKPSAEMLDRLGLSELSLDELALQVAAVEKLPPGTDRRRRRVALYQVIWEGLTGLISANEERLIELQVATRRLRDTRRLALTRLAAAKRRRS